MHISSSSVITLLGAAVLLVSETFASPNQHHQMGGLNSLSNFNHLNPSKSIMEIQNGDMQPVAYIQTRLLHRTLYGNNRFIGKKGFGNRNNNHLGRKHQHDKKKNKMRKMMGRRNKRARFFKRDYATTLQYLQAAINSYKKDTTASPPVELVQLEQQLPSTPAPVTPAMMVSPPPPPQVVTPPADLEDANPPLPDLGETAEPTSADIELGNEISEAGPAPVAADIEEDDAFDPEEDPDDVDDPPVVNGVAVEREE